MTNITYPLLKYICLKYHSLYYPLLPVNLVGMCSELIYFLPHFLHNISDILICRTLSVVHFFILAVRMTSDEFGFREEDVDEIDKIIYALNELVIDFFLNLLITKNKY